MTDIHLQPHADSGELLVFNDEDEELARAIIDEWVDDESDDFLAQVEPVLRGVVSGLQAEGALECLCLMKPYSFVLVDEEQEPVAELWVQDDHAPLLLDDALLHAIALDVAHGHTEPSEK